MRKLVKRTTVMDPEQISRFSLNNILDQKEAESTRSKVVVTLGPESSSENMIQQFLDHGISIFRINLAFESADRSVELINMINKVFKQNRNPRYSIIIELEGSFPRTCNLKQGLSQIVYEVGDELLLNDDYHFKGTKAELGCNVSNLEKYARVGSKINLAESSIVGQVVAVQNGKLKIKILTGGVLNSNKKMFIPYSNVKLESVINESDKQKLNSIFKQIPNRTHVFDFLSFDCQNKEDIFQMKSYLETINQSQIRIIGKVWTFESIKNIRSILKSVDGIMISRGDLPCAVDIEKIFISQKYIIQEANSLGVPVITAGQMLQSMVKSPRPTRAEASDVANSVLDGTDCCQLSAETSIGQFAIESVKQMINIIAEAEKCANNNMNMMHRNEKKKDEDGGGIASMAVSLSYKMNTSMIVVVTSSGRLAKLVAKYRPNAKIVAVTQLDKVIKELSIFRNVLPFQVDSLDFKNELIDYVVQYSINKRLCEYNQQIIVIQGEKGNIQDAEISLVSVQK